MKAYTVGTLLAVYIGPVMRAYTYSNVAYWLCNILCRHDGLLKVDAAPGQADGDGRASEGAGAGE